MRPAIEAISQNPERTWLRLPQRAWARAAGELATIFLGAVAFVLLSLATAFAGPSEEASAVIDRWEAAYSANDPDAVAKLYTQDAIIFGSVSPIIFDGTEPIRAAFAHLIGNDNKVRVSHRRILVLFDDSVLVTGSYEFKSTEHLAPSRIFAGFSMLVVKRDGRWLISYHTSFHPPVTQGSSAAEIRGFQ